MKEQSYSNHRMFVPGYHYAAFGILVINLLWSLYRLIVGLPGVPVFDRVLDLAVAVALVLVLAYTRTFPLKAQDRIIRLEERARLEALLPPDLRARIPELRPRHLVALRFASDGEVAELTRRVLSGELAQQNDIKKAIRTWRADNFRM